MHVINLSTTLHVGNYEKVVFVCMWPLGDSGKNAALGLYGSSVVLFVVMAFRSLYF